MATFQRVQATSKTFGAGQSGTAVVPLPQPTQQGNGILVAAATNTGDSVLTCTGFSTAWTSPSGTGTHNGVRAGIFYLANAAPRTSVTVKATLNRPMITYVEEIKGVLPSSPLDVSIVTLHKFSSTVDTGLSPSTTFADIYLFGLVANDASFGATPPTQSGFSGWQRLIHQASPFGDLPAPYYDDACRLGVYVKTLTATGKERLLGTLSDSQRYVAGFAAFKLTTPQQMSFRGDAIVMSGSATVSVSARMAFNRPAITTSGAFQIAPFWRQYVLAGLRVGDGTPYRITVDTFRGYETESADDPVPEGDGSIPGEDRQLARTNELRFVIRPTAGAATLLDREASVNQQIDTLARALRPRRTGELEMLFRDPGRPVQMVRGRPKAFTLSRDPNSPFAQRVDVVWEAADPRIYSATEHVVDVPAGVDTTVTNAGSIDALPVVTFTGGVGDASRLVLENLTTGVVMNIVAPVLDGQRVVVDIEARVTRAPRDVLTVAAIPRIGAWQLPRDNFLLAPGANVLRFTPTGNAICRIRWRDTWHT